MTPRSLLAIAPLAGPTVLATQTDERLIDLMRAGCEPAFDAVVARYRAPILRYLRRMLPPERAEDVAQQVFINAFDAIGRNSADVQLRPWLYRIARNAAIDSLRDTTPRFEQLDESIDGVERPDQALERRESVRAAIAAVSALPSRQRDAVFLRELEGRSYEDIASALGVSHGAVRQLLVRARTTLKTGLNTLMPAGMWRLPWSAGSDSAARASEACGSSAASAMVAQVGITALVTGTVVGGAVVAPKIRSSPELAHAAVPAQALSKAALRTSGDPFRLTVSFRMSPATLPRKHQRKRETPSVPSRPDGKRPASERAPLSPASGRSGDETKTSPVSGTEGPLTVGGSETLGPEPCPSPTSSGGPSPDGASPSPDGASDGSACAGGQPSEPAEVPAEAPPSSPDQPASENTGSGADGSSGGEPSSPPGDGAGEPASDAGEPASDTASGL